MTSGAAEVLILGIGAFVILALAFAWNIPGWLVKYKRRRRWRKIMKQGGEPAFTTDHLSSPAVRPLSKEFNPARAIVEAGSVMRHGKGSKRRARYRKLKKAGKGKGNVKTASEKGTIVERSAGDG